MCANISCNTVFSFFLLVKHAKEGCYIKKASKLERDFQSNLIKEIETNLDGCMIFKMDQMQGLPDLLILRNEKWATLECKRYEQAKKQPNQEYYVNKMNQMSFSRFISPENKEEVLDELYRSFKSEGLPCSVRRKQI